mmetsp:Transcript_29557/g.39460  ORF Transcript_29557/g.39460 Transcript_29557/m.39460 type:complete len:90 (+) Transcript_29557:109-378(+)
MEDTEEEEVCVRNHDVEEITLSKRASSTARSFCRFCRFRTNVEALRQSKKQRPSYGAPPPPPLPPPSNHPSYLPWRTLYRGCTTLGTQY